MITSNRGNFWDGEELFYCKTCKNQLPKNFLHNSEHEIVSMDFLKFCGNCNEIIESDWSYCAWCGQKFGDW